LTNRTHNNQKITQQTRAPGAEHDMSPG